MSQPLTDIEGDETSPGFGAKVFQALIDKSHRDRDEWVAMCEKVLTWHRLNRLMKDAAPSDAKEGDAALTWLLRSSRVMGPLWSDPRISNRADAARVDALLWKLEEAWEQTHNDLSATEADALCAQYFPAHEPGA